MGQMGRPSIEVAEQDSVEDLKKAYLSCKSAVESRRIQAIWLLRQGIYWNGPKVVTWINEELGKHVHQQRAYEYLKAIGMSLQRPRPRHAKADPEAQQRFEKNAS